MNRIQDMASSGNFIYECRGLSLSIDGIALLKGLTFSIARGEFVSLLGANGAGKSTLLKCLMKLHTGWTGSVLLEGRELGSYNSRELARKSAYLPQLSGVFPGYTVLEFMDISLYAYPRDFDRKTAVEKALEMTETSSLAHRTMDTLSGGERQKVLLASAVAQGADVVLLDEPATFLDPRYRNEVQELLVRLNREAGTAVISASHDINSAVLYSSRILGLKEGRLIFDMRPAEFMTAANLRELYGADFRLAAHPESGRLIVV